MGSLSWVSLNPHIPPSTHNPLRQQNNNLRRISTAVSCRKPDPSVSSNDSTRFSQPPAHKKTIFHKSLVPVAVALAVFMSSSPANAGFLSGSTGIESVPGPELPQIDFLNRWNDENQKKYAEADARFKESPLLKKLLEKSKLNKEKNQQSIQDKYCLRGAEWGVGDCSTEGMTPEERDNFISALKQKGIPPRLTWKVALYFRSSLRRIYEKNGGKQVRLLKAISQYINEMDTQKGKVHKGS